MGLNIGHSATRAQHPLSQIPRIAGWSISSTHSIIYGRISQLGDSQLGWKIGSSRYEQCLVGRLD
jgi:hypothetical protein